MTAPLAHLCGDCVCVESPATAALYIEVGGSGCAPTLGLVGTLNVYTAPILTARIEDALKHGARSLVVNLAGISHFDSEVSVGALLRALRRAQMGNGTLLLAEVPDPVRRAIRARGLGLVLHSFPSEEAAVEFLASWRAAP